MKTVIITGTSKGIGLETALAFGREGYRVFATMRNPGKAVSLREKVENESLNVHIAQMDVDSDDSVKNCINAIQKEHGQIDVLINNAGIECHGSIEETDLSKFKSVMETNYFGPLRCIKHLLPHMRNNRSGCIINVASIAGKIANTPLGAYGASKFALEAISEALAQEVKQFNIRVAIVEPGIIDTKMARDVAQDGAGRSIYMQVNRFSGLFAASLETPTQASSVADKILEIAKSESWQLRYPVGPDAVPFLNWRASMTDEEWITWNAATDADWYKSVQDLFGLDARKAQKSLGS
ncbi:SDR family oxidoreductase [Antarcticibacterium flavum]|uniref:SDR family oxidoreductase n=1 Tax=Antarcticibacterium flavum TaxID=2058175 RepID=A0A5B7X1A7_9FLAO|nr:MULTISPECIES: SDR family oxidoreductase [Antarcticibacterium]MCM4161308.1 oxidoreductase [Antarcticibacterium sp. W02-3]QCY69089.1 SDR family oxidoreductase [Antarcticibacterium flavum]